VEITNETIEVMTDGTIAKAAKETIAEAIKGAVVEVVDGMTARTSREEDIVTTLLERALVATGKRGAHFGQKDEIEETTGASSARVRKAERAARAIVGVATAMNINKATIVETIIVNAPNNKDRDKTIPDIPKTIMLCLWRSRKATTMILRPGASSRRTAKRRRPKEKTRTRLCNGASRGRA